MDAQHRVNKRRRAWGYQIETMLTLESIREGVRPFEGESVSLGFRPRWRGSDPFSDRLLILLPSAICHLPSLFQMSRLAFQFTISWTKPPSRPGRRSHPL